MVNAAKLEKDRIEKLNELSPDETTDYIESLVLEMYKCCHDGIIETDFDISDAADKLDEIVRISKKKNYTNVDAVILDRKLSYLSTAYSTAFYLSKENKVNFHDALRFAMDMMEIELLFYNLKEIVRVYYYNFSNYGVMEDLLMDLSDDGLRVDSEIRSKYVYDKHYGYNCHLMQYLDISIKVKVEVIQSKLDECDKKYLIAANDGYNDFVDEFIDGIHETITGIYKNRDDFEVEVAKQTGLIDALLKSISDLKDNTTKNNDEYLKVKNKILDFIDADNGFAELSADAYENYNDVDGKDDFDKWMKRQPKYNIRNQKFIYPENRN